MEISAIGEKKKVKGAGERIKTQIVDAVSRYEGEVLLDKKDGFGIEHNEKSVYLMAINCFYSENDI